MKYLFTFTFFLLSAYCFLQTGIPIGARYVKVINSTQYVNGDTLKHKELYIYYDSTMNTLSDENTPLTAFTNNSSSRSVTINTELEHSTVEINSVGDTIAKFVYVYDESGNRTHNYQINNGDTVVYQRWVYDNFGNTIKLFEKSMFSSKIYLCMEWKYDSHNNYVYEMYNNELDNTTEILKFKNKYDKSGKLKMVKAYSSINNSRFVLHYKSTYSKNQLKIDYNYNTVGYNYGIKIRTVKGGCRIENYFENGDLKSMENFDSNGVLLSSVYVSIKLI